MVRGIDPIALHHQLGNGPEHLLPKGALKAISHGQHQHKHGHGKGNASGGGDGDER